MLTRCIALHCNLARAILPNFSSDVGKLEGVKEEIDVYVEKLSRAIGRDLSNSLLTKVQFQRNINWLLRLGLGETVCASEESAYVFLFIMLKYMV